MMSIRNSFQSRDIFISNQVPSFLVQSIFFVFGLNEDFCIYFQKLLLLSFFCIQLDALLFHSIFALFPKTNALLLSENKLKLFSSDG